jgi:hypothetical protein
LPDANLAVCVSTLCPSAFNTFFEENLGNSDISPGFATPFGNMSDTVGVSTLCLSAFFGLFSGG